MIEKIVWLVTGMIIGGTIGMIAMCLFQISGGSDDEERKENRNE